MEAGRLLILVLGWAAYGGLHSLLAAPAVKAALSRAHPGLARAYRLLYNAVAVVALLPLAWAIHQWGGAPLWRWPDPLWWLAQGLALGAAVVFAATLRDYDGSAFLGLRQWRQGEAHPEQEPEPLRLSFAHRFVRHPWYTCGLAILWTRELDAAQLVSAAAITGYLVVGARLEERKLRRAHGQAYADYLRRVPGLIPRPGRHLSPQEAADLEARAQQGAEP
jgi:protein-S-isoprenylcysteine O-methyltransferase Ste14